MFRTVGILIAIVLLIACAEENPYLTGNAEFDANPTQESYDQLIKNQMSLLRNPDSDPQQRANALNMGYLASMRMDKTTQAIGFLNTYVKENQKAEDTPEKLITLAQLLKANGKDNVAETLAQGFMLSRPDHALIPEAQKIVSQDAPSVEEKITAIGNKMFDIDKGRLNEDMARNFVDLCEAYAISAPGQKDVPEYLHKAAETARTMRSWPKAMSLYDWILTDYSDHPRAPQALFLKAFTFDESLQDKENAKKYYLEFLEKYPEDDFADDTQFLLDNLGKSSEDMLKTLTENAKKNKK